jgi:uncharacterized membrane protein YdbT with pleckstrin-like domain
MDLAKALNLKEGEQALYVAHQFPLTYWPWIAGIFVLLVLPFFLLFPLFAWGVWGAAIFFLLILIGLILGLRQAMKWFFNVLVITGERVIDVYQKGFFDRTVSPVPFQNIQSVSFRMKGLCQTIFKYGTVIIEMSQASAKIEARKVRHPHVIQQLIDELRLRAKERPEDDEKTNVLKDFTEKLSIQDLKKLVEKLKRDERDEAVAELYGPGK